MPTTAQTSVIGAAAWSVKTCFAGLKLGGHVRRRFSTARECLCRVLRGIAAMARHLLGQEFSPV